MPGGGLWAEFVVTTTSRDWRSRHQCARIRDDGHGFDLDDAKGKGLGLISMEERVRHLGGTFAISPKRGDGTRIEIRIPLEINPAAVATESSTP